MIILATRTTATTRATTAGEATIGLGVIAIMVGGAGRGGAADAAGTAADGMVIIDSELGHRCPAFFATARTRYFC
jgi:hypothetical protein